MSQALVTVESWERAVEFGYNPHSFCSCCSKSVPVALIEIGDAHHRAASFQLCEKCKSDLKKLL